MNETKELTLKQESFCVHYTTIGSETFSHGTKSAVAAGYSEKSAYSQASTLLKNPKIQQRIKELHTENMSRNNITVDKVLADLEHDKIMARQAGQYSVSKECSVAQGKYLAMFTDNVHQTTQEPVKLSDEERAILKEAARKMTALKSKGHEPEYGETPEDRRREIAERNMG